MVYETKDVNELSVENRSHKDIYVQSGDIVKGGQQDRVLAVDLIVPPRSGKDAYSRLLRGVRKVEQTRG